MRKIFIFTLFVALISDSCTYIKTENASENKIIEPIKKLTVQHPDSLFQLEYTIIDEFVKNKAPENSDFEFPDERSKTSLFKMKVTITSIELKGITKLFALSTKAM